jgi:8-amino-7-oxononanoate synthase
MDVEPPNRAELDEGLAQSLEQRREQNLYRKRVMRDNAQDVEIRVDGRNCLSFCSNDYLALANHPAVINALQQGAARYGVGSGASHLISGHCSAHHDLEQELAEFVARPRALLFSTGYMANIGIITALYSKQTAVFEDRLNHASLLDAGLFSGARFRRFAHTDIAHLDTLLQTSHSADKLIVTDGVFSMDGDLAPLPRLFQTAIEHNARLLVDDAHGFGVLGPNGQGSLAHFGLHEIRNTILMCTLGKALGTFGAFVAASDTVIETLIQKARTYIYTTALPPALAEATRAGLKLVREESWRRDKLSALITRFRAGARQLGLPLMESMTPIQPLSVGDSVKALQLSEYLQQQGIYVSAIRPPTVAPGSARLRITFSANHEEQHVDRLLSVLDKARNAEFTVS